MRSALTTLQAHAKELKVQKQALRKSVQEMAGVITTSCQTIAAQTSAQIAVQVQAIQLLQSRYKKELAERKRLHNLVQELRGNIRVYCRVRPAIASELEGGSTVCVTYPDEGEVQVANAKRQLKTWEFDRVFRPTSTNDEVFKETEDLVVSVLDGYNVCIFAYGQTGAITTTACRTNT
jgi:hypothetical protein